MIVCHCQALTDSDIIRAIVDGALTVRDIAEATLATTDCGTCTETVILLLKEYSSTVSLLSENVLR